MKNESLIKPDMGAVLRRTHISRDLQDFLLPVFEAVSNGVHAIEERYGENSRINGKIEIHFENINDPANIRISISDNGVGLNEENFNSFKTPFSGYKLKRKGRGFGRFIAFKIFYKIIYISRYEFMGKPEYRHFQFDIYKDEEIIHMEKPEKLNDAGVKVIYSNPLKDWSEFIISINERDIAEQIGKHFLPYFLYKGLPEIYLRFDSNKPQNITRYFENIFKESYSGEFYIEIDGIEEKISFSLAKIPKTRLFGSHCLLFSAANRIIGRARDLSNKLGKSYFTDERENKYIILSVVKSNAFEARLNDSRTNINITEKIIEEIVSKVTEHIQEYEHEQIKKIKDKQACELRNLLQEQPSLRLGLRGKTIDEYVSAKPNNWSREQFISELAIERDRANKDLSKAILDAANNPKRYTENIKNIVKNLDESKKEALAEYIIHRKKIIELIEAARRYNNEGKISAEDAIHDLIFKRFRDNKDISYFEHNLWVIDDALAFLPYISSDRTMHGGKRKRGDKVPDLIFFDESLVLGDNDGTTITIIEFKKPGRDDYEFGSKHNDPVLQVLNTLEKAVEAGGITRSDGSIFTFSGVVRKFAYIIADHTKSLVTLLKNHDFKNEYNPRIYFRFRDNEQIYIQAMGYDTLVENAKKRNQAFFSPL